MDNYTRKILNICYDTRNHLQTKEAKFDLQAIIDSIEFSPEALLSEVNNYYNNRNFVERWLVKLKIKDIRYRIKIFQEELKYLTE
ncbi:MAG: hypothetical protein AABW83_03630 [Nanoarchaeota archaeon]